MFINYNYGNFMFHCLITFKNDKNFVLYAYIIERIIPTHQRILSIFRFYINTLLLNKCTQLCFS